MVKKMMTKKRICTIVRKIAELNQQEKPFRCFVDGNKMYGEIKDRNPIVVAIKKKGKWHLSI